ncbi:MAG: hypothetical protein HQK75_20025 [Candidatus Magnetomorum sp.]|nr:hypothetical protein [Candidatus Magnetomorum sp.]
MKPTVKYFTDRNHEKKDLCNFLQGKLLTKTIMDINGMSGMGKTQLLTWAYHEAMRSQKSVAYYDFKNSTNTYQYVDVLRSIATSNIDRFANTDYSEMKNLANSISQKITISDDDINDLSKAYNKALSNDLSSKRVLLFFDTTEEALPKTLEILDSQVLSQHVNHGNFLVTFSGEKPLQWKTADIRKRRATLPLNEFKQDEMVDMIDRLATEKSIQTIDDEVLELIQYLSAGNPGIIYDSLHYLSDKFTRNSIDKKDCHGLVKHLYSTIVCEKILSQIGDLKIEDVDNLKLISQIAMLRTVNLHSFRILVTKNFPDSFSQQSAFYYDDVLKKIHKKSSLFYSTDFRSGYVLSKCIRRIFQLNTLLTNSNNFNSFKQSILDYYKTMISKTTGIDQVNAIVEYFFTKYFTPPQCFEMPEQNYRCFEDELNTIIGSNHLKDERYEKEAHLICIKDAIENDEELKHLL